MANETQVLQKLVTEDGINGLPVRLIDVNGNPQGNSISTGAQSPNYFVPFSGATAITTSGALFTGGSGGQNTATIINTGTGTATVVIEGSHDQTNWFAAGYARVDGQSSLVRSASPIAMGAAGSGTDKQALAIADYYYYYRFRISAVTGAVAVSVIMAILPI